MVNPSILTSIKKSLGIEEDYEQFDPDIIMYINSALMNLNQIGVGPEAGFMIEDKTATWEEYLEARTDLYAVQTYIYLKVRLIFDPPQMGYLVDAINKQIDELVWRLNVQAEGLVKMEENSNSVYVFPEVATFNKSDETRVLIFDVTGDLLARNPDCDFENINKNSSLSIKFNFADNWKTLKKALIIRSGVIEEHLILEGDQHIIPERLLTGTYFGIKLYGISKTNAIPTNTLGIDL